MSISYRIKLVNPLNKTNCFLVPYSDIDRFLNINLDNESAVGYNVMNVGEDYAMANGCRCT